MRFSLLVLAVAGAVSAQQQNIGATQQQLTDVQGQYDNSGFYQAIGNSLTFGIQLQPQALLEVVYSGAGVIQNGQDYPASAVAQVPNLYLTPLVDQTVATQLATGEYTVMLADAAAVGGPDSQGLYRHYLANSVKPSSAPSASNLTFSLGLNNPTTPYAGPGPLANSGTHRYAWLVFQQPSSYRAQSGLTSPGHFTSLTSYVQAAGLGNLIASSFFTVTASGTPSFSPIATSAYTATGSAAAAGSTSAGAGSMTKAASGSASPSSGTVLPSTSAIRTGAAAQTAAPVGLVAAVFALFALA